MNTEQRHELIKQLSQFMEPSAFITIVKKFDFVPDERFFNDSVYKPVREAWAAGHFALGLKQR